MKMHGKCEMLPTMEVLRLAHYCKLEILQVRGSLGKYLGQLRMLVIDGCRLLKGIDW